MTAHLLLAELESRAAVQDAGGLAAVLRLKEGAAEALLERGEAAGASESQGARPEGKEFDDAFLESRAISSRNRREGGRSRRSQCSDHTFLGQHEAQCSAWFSSFPGISWNAPSLSSYRACNETANSARTQCSGHFYKESHRLRRWSPRNVPRPLSSLARFGLWQVRSFGPAS